MVPRLELSIVVWPRHIPLKVLCKMWESDVKKGLRFTPSSYYFTKILKF